MNKITFKTFMFTLDWVITIAFFLIGVWGLVSQWPEPSWWAWMFFILGILGVPLNLFQPVQKLRTWALRRFVKR